MAYEDDVSCILDDLKKLSEDEFFLKYIYIRETWYFENQMEIEDYDDKMSAIIDRFFDVKKEDYLIVGSAKIGFSLSPNKNLKTFCSNPENTDEQSDLDIAIVSPEMFEELWEKLKDHKYRTILNYYGQVSSGIFRGFINDKHIIKQSYFKSDFKEKIDDCVMDLRDEFGIIEPINFRIYKSQKDLYLYTLDGIKKCKQEVEK